MKVTIEQTLDQAGTGAFQRGLLGVFGLVWAADAMQVLAVGFTGAAIAKTFGLTVPQALQTGTLFFLGMLIGAAVFGRLADKYGRRRVLLVTVACDAVFGLLSAFAPNFGVLLALRFMTGVAVGGTLPVDYAMMAEFLPAKNRGRWLVMLEGFWAVGTVVIALAAWATSLAGVEDAWRYIFIVTAAPALIGIWLRLWVPESPMHLLKSERPEEAKSVMNRVLRRNGKPELPPKARLEAPLMVTNEKLLSPNLRQRTLTTLAIWFLVSVSYYGIFTWIPAKLAGDGFGFVRGYGFLVVVALAQLPGYALAAYGVEAWGRKKTLIAFLFISAAACALFTVANSSAVVGASILVMSFALLGTWGALYAFTPELYPTGLRASGMGAAGAMARLGGLLAPSALALVISQSFYVAVALFAGLLALAGVIAFFIDVETRQKALN
ncbi:MULTISPECIES: MFS transporter [Brucella/Ochrobactrum group]|jgi:putative MFS transporter|uniref:MFS transporter n=1 Tax=Brucella pseudintermedia TaxID=370111 RepID=A0ABY5UJ74_9HYPH|nr:MULTISPECIES: MFS transporter [Brucella/Ochrobactrum group]KAB2679917.1 MFS transporter [Brucella pseudintermedia]MCO7727496.1 MFS transporter [Brucella intermedia]NKE74930.1 MFS transporter [Ochrobactrum sp. MC-1LL]TWH03261.1 putative MFS transporter [Ochrobactrum sp. J50]UWL62417.1 MFS transporter [Brucella pseudintermedia]